MSNSSLQSMYRNIHRSLNFSPAAFIDSVLLDKDESAPEMVFFKSSLAGLLLVIQYAIDRAECSMIASLSRDTRPINLSRARGVCCSSTLVLTQFAEDFVFYLNKAKKACVYSILLWR